MPRLNTMIINQLLSTLVSYRKSSEPKFSDHSIVIWTTTPWTIPGNRALAVHEDIEYQSLTINKNDINKNYHSKRFDRKLYSRK